MTKVVSGKEMIRIEQSLESNKALSNEYMEKAGEKIADFVLKKFSKPLSVLLLCGKGNNSGDAYVAGRYLLEQGVKVKSYKVLEGADSSLCLLNYKRFKESGGKTLLSLDSFNSFDLIIDGIFGNGFKGELDKITIDVLKAVNKNSSTVLAIDVPSGIDANCGLAKSQTAMRADYTLTLGLPKTGLFYKVHLLILGKLNV